MSGKTGVSGVERSERFKQRFGIFMCLVYAIAYSGFVFISVFNVELMDTVMPFGLNLAVFYGMGLILFALFLAFIYSQVCNASERRAQSQTGSASDDTDSERDSRVGGTGNWQ